jgi:hypothetical protein
LLDPIAQFCKRYVLKLADSLTGDAELFSDFIQRFLLLPVEAEAPPQDRELAIIQYAEKVPNHVMGGFVFKRLVGIRCGHVGHDVTQPAGVFIGQWLIE